MGMFGLTYLQKTLSHPFLGCLKVFSFQAYQIWAVKIRPAMRLQQEGTKEQAKRLSGPDLADLFSPKARKEKRKESASRQQSTEKAPQITSGTRSMLLFHCGSCWEPVILNMAAEIEKLVVAL